MTFLITGADSGDRGPCGCVVRFMHASSIEDSAAAYEELHPDHRAGMAGEAHGPPGVVEAEVLEPEQGEDRVLVPTRLVGADGSEQRFVFVVRPSGEGWGIDLDASLQATLGGDPVRMMEDAMRTAVAPLAEGFSQMGEAIGQAMGGAGGGAGGGRVARRIAADAEIPASAAVVPERLVAHLVDVDLHHRRQRADAQSAWESSCELHIRCIIELDPAWTALAITGVVLAAATSCAGEDLRPVDAGDDCGAERFSSWERERREVYFKLQLASPGQAFTGLAELGGTVRLALVGGELLEIALGPVAGCIDRDVALPALGLVMHLQRDADGHLELRLPAGGFDLFEDIIPMDAGGEAINQSWSGSGDGEVETRTYASGIGDDATLILRFWGRRETVTLPFSASGLSPAVT